MERASDASHIGRVLVALVVAAGALTAGTMVLRDRALEEAYADAQRRAELYALSTVRSALVPSDFDGAMSDARAGQLSAEIEASILSDPSVARVRLWTLDRILLFSTDPEDALGEATADPVIDLALARGAWSRPAVEQLSRGTDETGPIPTALLQTFTPVALRGASEPHVVSEIEQFASEVEERANDPWGTLLLGGTVATALLALLAFVAVVRGSRRRDGQPERPARGSGRRRDRERSAAVEAVTGREGPDPRSDDERMRELREALRRSEAERAMLRAGRPETVLEAELRQLRTDLRDERSRAKAAEALAAGKGDLSAVQDQLSRAEQEMERALERARIAEGRADTAEEQARLTAEFTAAAEQRIDLLEAKLQEVAAAGTLAAQDGSELVALREELATAGERAAMLERRAAEAETTAASLAGATVSAEALDALEGRMAAAEARAAEAEERVRTLEDEAAEHGSSFRHRLGVRAAGRKLAAPEPAPFEEPKLGPETALRAAIARGLRGPLTRAAGLTLSLQGAVGPEGKGALRQLSSSIRRLDQLAADLHDVHRIQDGTLPISRRRTDVTALLTTTLEEADQLQEDRLVRLDAERRLQATVDPVRLRQVVEGMLEGARERTRAGAAIVVRARATEDGIRIRVEDDERTPASIGPEMSLAARLAELLGTELVAEGSGFHVVLPADGEA